MARLASLTIPIRYAASTVQGPALPLRTDPSHAVKCALATTFGDGTVRPWRLVGDDGDAYMVAGWLRNGLATGEAERLAVAAGLGIHVEEYRPRTGDRFVLDVHASPQKNKSVRGPDGKRRRTAPDVAAGAPSAGAAYVAWIERKLAEPRTGIAVLSAPRIRTTRAVNGMYRAGDRITTTRIPRVEATVEVEVRDGGTFEDYLTAGLGPLAFLGYGSLFPMGLADAA